MRPEPSAASSVERLFQYSLLGLAACGFLAMAGSGYLDTPSIVLAYAGLMLRAVLLAGETPRRIPRRLVQWSMLAYGGFFLLDVLAISRQALPALVHLAVFLATLQVLTAARGRGYLGTAVLSFVGLVSAAVLSLSLVFLAALALYLGFAVAALTSAEIRRSLRQARATARSGTRGLPVRLAALAAGMALGILALSGGLFLLSPHIAASELAGRFFHRTALPGFSRRVSLGEIAGIKTSSRAVMHVRLYTPAPAGGLKWRGGALTEFDGQHWWNPGAFENRLYTAQGRLDLVPVAERRPGRHLVYDVHLDAIDSDALFFAGTPEHVDLRAPYLLGNGSSGFRLRERPPQGFRYEGYSLLEDPPESRRAVYPLPVLDAAERSHCLQLPKLDPRIGALAQRLGAGAASDLEKARAVERHLRAGYAYSLDLPRRRAADPLAEFLFARKRGHCEYFASAMAVLLRAQGIPARLATGFQSGIHNDLTDMWLIRAGDAHAWVEAWIPARGWTVFDPTPAAPPTLRFALGGKLALLSDAAEGLWREWVVSYDPSRQGSLMDRAQRGAARLGIRWFDTLSDAQTYWDGSAGKRVRRWTPWLLAALALGTLLRLAVPPVARWLGMRRGVRRARRGKAGIEDATLLYRRMLRIVGQRGYRKPAWFTPAEFAASLPHSRWAETVGEFTTAYNAWRFGGRLEAAPQLSLLLEQLERAE